MDDINNIDKYEFKVVESISQYMKSIEDELEKLKSDMSRDEYLAFRGQSNAEFELMPSIGRPLKYNCDRDMLSFEKNLINSAQHEYPNEFLNSNSPIELLIKLQHFGIPTRLLDITTNALVALYFACCESESDAEIQVFKLKNDFRWNDRVVEAIADTYRLNITEKSIGDYYNILVGEPYFKNQRKYFEYEDLDEEFLDENPNEHFYTFRTALSEGFINPIAIQPPRMFSRLNAQSGQFLIFSNELIYDEKNRFPKEVGMQIVPMKKSHESIQIVFRIPSNCKSKIIKDLAVLGITRKSLFHDNVDIVCGEIVNAINDRTKKIKGETTKRRILIF